MNIKWLIVLLIAGSMAVTSCAKKTKEEAPAAEPATEEVTEPVAEPAMEAEEEAPTE